MKLAIDTQKIYEQLLEKGGAVATFFTDSFNSLYNQFYTGGSESSEATAANQDSDDEKEKTERTVEKKLGQEQQQTQGQIQTQAKATTQAQIETQQQVERKVTKEKTILLSGFEKISILEKYRNVYMNPCKINIALLFMQTNNDGPFVNRLSAEGFPDHIITFTVMESMQKDFDQFSFFYYEYEYKDDPNEMFVKGVFQFKPYIGSFLFKKNASLFEAFQFEENLKPPKKLADYSSAELMVNKEISRILLQAEKERPNATRVLVSKLKQHNITLKQHAGIEELELADAELPDASVAVVHNPIISRKKTSKTV